jgi:signal transduction histidine kinase
MLLGLLFSVYVGGRYIFVQMIRQTEENVRMVGDDIRRLVYGELDRLHHLAAQSAGVLARADDPLRDGEALRARLPDLFAQHTPVDMAIFLTPDGQFVKGYLRGPGEPFREIAPDELQPYLSSASPLRVALDGGNRRPGILVCGGRPLFFAFAPVEVPDGRGRGFVVLGSLVQNAAFMDRINGVTPGMEVRMDTSRPGGVSVPGAMGLPAGPAPALHEVLTYGSGGHWHLGDNAFEAVIPVTDIFGRKVTAITVRLPGSFSSLASIALGWLTSFIACVGIVFVLPMFWLQSRVLLNPLSRLTRQIREIGEHHLDGDCGAIHWPKDDEFGVLARSVNDMAAALASKTRQNAQGEQNQRALIAGVPDGLCVFDRDARLVEVRKQPDDAPPIPGLLAGSPVSPAVFPEGDCQAFRGAVGEAFRADRIQMVILPSREPDGSRRHFETRISRMDDALALVVLRDVTKEWHERETREHVEAHLAKVQKMESLGTMAAGIAHDFNNILAIIQNTVEFTWENPADGEREAVGTIRQATDKGAALTRELMTYAGHTRTAFRRAAPNALILELEKLMNGVIAQNVILDFKLAPGLPPVDVDPHQFWKVVINLLKNASEALNGCSGHITISTGPFTLTPQNVADFYSTHALPLEDGVLFQIADNGPGLPKEVIDRVFEPFVSTKAVGRGLGLATVFGIVDVHNGGIAITSGPGKGTCFRIWLPAARALEETLSPLSVPAQASGRRAAGLPEGPPGPGTPLRPKVLLVEDDPSILLTTRIVLHSLGVEALAASSQREVQRLFSQFADEIRLILLDAQAGDLDNVRLLSILRRSQPAIPTVILSGHTEEKIRAMFTTEPYDAFLGKPYTRDELGAILARFRCLT